MRSAPRSPPPCAVTNLLSSSVPGQKSSRSTKSCDPICSAWRRSPARGSACWYAVRRGDRGEHVAAAALAHLRVVVVRAHRERELLERAPACSRSGAPRAATCAGRASAAAAASRSSALSTSAISVVGVRSAPARRCRRGTGSIFRAPPRCHSTAVAASPRRAAAASPRRRTAAKRRGRRPARSGRSSRGRAGVGSRGVGGETRSACAAEIIAGGLRGSRELEVARRCGASWSNRSTGRWATATRGARATPSTMRTRSVSTLSAEPQTPLQLRSCDRCSVMRCAVIRPRPRRSRGCCRRRRQLRRHPNFGSTSRQ